MTSLLEKFRNARFPNWMRQVKEDSIKVGIKAANDNIANSAAGFNGGSVVYPDEMDRARLNFLSYRTAAVKVQALPTAAIMNNTVKDVLPDDVINSFKFKLKMPVSVKRHLRRDKKNYQKVRKWLDEAEESANQALFGGRANER